MGACIAAIVLALGLPGAARIKRWARLPGTTKNKSALSDLIFVLVWATLCQIGLVGTCVIALALGGPIALAPANITWSHSLGLALGFSTFFYAVAELFVVVQTLSQMGVVIIDEEQKNKDTSSSTHLSSPGQ
ncbi:hypothetical protein ASF79_10755 [Agreia sp. Leaf335]|nr:hypothetical protein ASF79_10755 [Agreia sp. Leaf335]